MHPTGLITALATPFDEAGALDLDAWRRLLQWQLSAGVEGVVVAGSTGEASMLEDVEYDALVREAVETVDGRVPVLAGTGLSGTARTIALTRRAAAAGADVALVVAPPYVRPTQAGLLAHYRAVAEQGGLPVMLYNVLKAVPVATCCRRPWPDWPRTSASSASRKRCPCRSASPRWSRCAPRASTC